MTRKFYIGTGKKLSDADFSRLEKNHGVEEAALRAVKEVEAGRSGFHSNKAVKCLYEPHIADRQAKGPARQKLRNSGLAYSKWKRKYPRTSFARIDKCASIAGAEVAALSTSWGLGQIMGFNHKACGYPTAVAMVEDFAKGEADQLEGMIKFIKSNRRMFAALKRKDWAAFAKSYNGPGYRQNRYDEKLAKAYRKWKKKLPADPTDRTANMLRMGDYSDEVKRWQETLIALGQDVVADGKFGPATEAATKALQSKLGLKPVDGIAGPMTMTAAQKAITEKLNEEKITADLALEQMDAAEQKADLAQEIVDDAAAEGRISTTNLTAGAVAVTGGTTAVTQVTEAVNKISETTSSVTETAIAVGPWGLLGIVTVGGGWYIWRERVRKAKAARKKKAMKNVQ